MMVEQAYLQERLQAFRRACYHMSRFPGSPLAARSDRVRQVTEAVARTQRELNELYRFYAHCYMDRMDEERMLVGFVPRYGRLTQSIREADDQLRDLVREMRRAAARFGPVVSHHRRRFVVDQWPTEFSRGAFRRNGRICMLPVQVGGLRYPGIQELLGMGYCLTQNVGHPSWYVADAKEPDLFDHKAFRHRMWWDWRDLPPGKTAHAVAVYGVGTHTCGSLAPKWWLKKHRNDPDLFIRDPDAKLAQPRRGGPEPSLNFWHPKVRRMLSRLCTEVTAEFKALSAARVWFGELAQEAHLSARVGGVKGIELGYNKTAIEAWHEFLRRTYGTIDKLNRTWRTRYKDFESVQPPPSAKSVPRVAPRGLTYEWGRFKQHGWHDWMKLCMTAVRKELPGLPFACRLSEGALIGAGHANGFDPVELFETFDIVADHGGLFTPLVVAGCRFLDSLNKAFGKSTGTLEWGGYSSGDIFDERDVKNAGLRDVWRLTSWGQTVFSYWYGQAAGWADTCNWTDPRLGYTVFRYSSSYIPLSIARANTTARVFFECPTVDPGVVILLSQASAYNAYPPYIIANAMRGLSELLESKGHNCGFLFERLLLDGRQDLDKHKVVLLPHGVTLPRAMTDRLLAWIRGGGVLIAVGPAGLYGPYGAPDGRLLAAAFGKNDWTRGPKGGHWKARFARQPKYPYPDDGRSFLAEGHLGKGKLFVANGSPSALREPAYEIIRTHAPRGFFAKDNKVELVMRRGKDCRYLSVFNADCRDAIEDEIVLRHPKATVVDIQNGFPVLTTAAKGSVRFKVRLAPAEGMVVRISD